MKLKNLTICGLVIGMTVVSFSANSQIRDVSNTMIFQISGDEAMRLQDDYVVDVSGAVKLQDSALTCNAGNEGAFRYNGSALQVCNGTAWRSIEFTPGDQHYFVLTKSTWNGNLGGLSGADAKCLTELTNEDWMGKSTANLSSGTVKALLGMNIYNIRSSTTYNFAVASSPTIGGATFDTASNRLGPDNLDSWDTASHFGDTYSYWTGLTGTSTRWFHDVGSPAPDCNGWTDGTMGSTGEDGTSSNLPGGEAGRYYKSGSNALCSASYHLICFVNVNP